jgi:hypothetical protein
MMRKPEKSQNLRHRARGGLSLLLGLLGAVTQACGLTDPLFLSTTEQSSANPGNGTGGGTGQVPGPRQSPFCALKWGRSWGGTNTEVQSSGAPAYPNNLGMMSIWFGYEQDDKLNPAITKMLTTLGPSGDPALRGVVPVFYGYFIPFKAQNWDGVSKNCAPDLTTPNVCTQGAQWIRTNRDKLRNVYASYADQVAAAWGTTSPLIWLFEPSFNDYLGDSQSNPLSLAELSAVATDLISQIKLRLPNALISHFASPAIVDLEGYFSALDLTYVDLVNVSGAAQNDYFGAGNSTVNTAATYRRLHAASGRHLFVDTGFGASAISNFGWLTAGAEVVNQRIADGVVAVQIDQAPSSMQSDIAALAPKLNVLDCGN